MPETNTKDPMVKLFSLWENKGKDGTKRFWSGIMGGVKFLMFRCKSTHPQAPMFEVYVVPFRKDKQRTASDDKDDYSAKPQQAADPAPVATPEDEELPF
jgi:hypothetical protein